MSPCLTFESGALTLALTLDDMTRPLETLSANPLIAKVTEVVIGVIVIGIVFRLIKGSLHRYIHNLDSRYRIRKLLSLVSYGLMLVFAASVFSSSLNQLTIIFGAASAGVAFALQEVITSLAGWLAISIGSYYKVGDRVQLGGIIGDVIDVSALRTTLMECGDWVKGDLYNGRIVRVANSFVFTDPVYNYSGDFPFLWDEFTVPIKYGGDHRLARQILETAVSEIVGEYISAAESRWAKMVQKYRIEDAQIEPMVSLVANDNWLEFTVRYVVDYKKRRLKKDQLFTRILDDIEATNGKVAFASTTFQLVEAPKFKVSLSEGLDSIRQSS